VDAAARAAVAAATFAAVAAARAAVDAATRAAVAAATFDAVAATRAAVDAATRAAVDAAARAAVDAATAATDLGNWFAFPGDMKKCADDLRVGLPGLMCAQKSYWMWQGGNQWSGWVAFLGFFRHVAELEIDYSKWDAWETLALHSGPRIVHKDFCIISDRPEVLLVDEQNRPHCEAGPFCRWRDGSALYAVHGVRIPAWIIERPELLNIKTIEAETNTEIQRVMIERFGWDRYATECGATVIDHDERFGTLYGRNGMAEFLRVINGSPEPDGSFRKYILPVAPGCEPLPDAGGELGEPQKLTALNAVASTYGLTGEEYAKVLEVRT
jgi:hypothetical protein